MRDKIAKCLKVEETSDSKPPYRCLPTTSHEWRELKAKRILALISSVECGDCGGRGVRDTGGFSPQQVPIEDTCPTCKGTGYRKLVARVECDDNCHECGHWHEGERCPVIGILTFPYPIDFDEHPELVGKPFTVEVE